MLAICPDLVSISSFPLAGKSPTSKCKLSRSAQSLICHVRFTVFVVTPKIEPMTPRPADTMHVDALPVAVPRNEGDTLIEKVNKALEFIFHSLLSENSTLSLGLRSNCDTCDHLQFMHTFNASVPHCHRL
jgi:hypothetical protein